MNDAEIKTKVINEEGECSGEKSVEPVKDIYVGGGNDQSIEIVERLDDANVKNHEKTKVLEVYVEGSETHDIEQKLKFDVREKPCLLEQSGEEIVLVEEIEITGEETKYTRKNT